MSDVLGSALRAAVPDLDQALQEAVETTVVWVLAVYCDGQIRMACNAPRDVAGELMRSVSNSWDDQIEMPSFKEH